MTHRPHEHEDTEETHTTCPVCHVTYLPHFLHCPHCGVERSESREVASIRQDLIAAGFFVPTPSL